MEFILEQQAQTAVLQAQCANFQAQSLQFQAKTEKRLDAITKLLRAGMQVLVSYQKETKTSIDALIAAQQRTDAKFDRWLDAQGGSATNGR